MYGYGFSPPGFSPPGFSPTTSTRFDVGGHGAFDLGGHGDFGGYGDFGAGPADKAARIKWLRHKVKVEWAAYKRTTALRFYKMAAQHRARAIAYDKEANALIVTEHRRPKKIVEQVYGPKPTEQVYGPRPAERVYGPKPAMQMDLSRARYDVAQFQADTAPMPTASAMPTTMVPVPDVAALGPWYMRPSTWVIGGIAAVGLGWLATRKKGKKGMTSTAQAA